MENEISENEQNRMDAALEAVTKTYIAQQEHIRELRSNLYLAELNLKNYENAIVSEEASKLQLSSEHCETLSSWEGWGADLLKEISP